MINARQRLRKHFLTRNNGSSVLSEQMSQLVARQLRCNTSLQEQKRFPMWSAPRTYLEGNRRYNAVEELCVRHSADSWIFEGLTDVEDVISCVMVMVILWVYEIIVVTPRGYPINPFILSRTRYYHHAYPLTRDNIYNLYKMTLLALLSLFRNYVY
jgi:hypothetical protein